MKKIIMMLVFIFCFIVSNSDEIKRVPYSVVNNVSGELKLIVEKEEMRRIELAKMELLKNELEKNEFESKKILGEDRTEEVLDEGVSYDIEGNINESDEKYVEREKNKLDIFLEEKRVKLQKFIKEIAKLEKTEREDEIYSLRLMTNEFSTMLLRELNSEDDIKESLSVEFKYLKYYEKNIYFGGGFEFGQRLIVTNEIENEEGDYYDDLGMYVVPFYASMKYSFLNNFYLLPYSEIDLGYPLVLMIENKNTGTDFRGMYYIAVGCGVNWKKLDVGLKYSNSRLKLKEKNSNTNYKKIGFYIGYGF